MENRLNSHFLANNITCLVQTLFKRSKVLDRNGVRSWSGQGQNGAPRLVPGNTHSVFKCYLT